MSMDEKTKDRVALITGATGSLGSVVAERFAASGFRLAVTGRSEEQLEKLTLSLDLDSDRVLALAGDVIDERFVRALIDAVVRRFGRLDFLLNTVGGWSGGKPVREIPFEQWKQAMDLNLHTAFLLSRAALEPMIEAGRGGRIVHVSARTALTPRPNQAEYAVSKRALIALTEVIAEEVKGSGITANTILPSIIDTPPNRERWPDNDHDAWVKPEHIAGMMLVLCGEEGSTINGSSIEMYGSV
jgi:NAD(P)-dependent dehydrogenase (short-subunit alcohol dehydrogenase family)